ncbi:hypothetical protein PENSPDRAFT_657329 [Peniophora sp. CONT]|nr:hypothetical protein PENSPDRAFT_657329 [Peniophora sp. CONT]
MAIPKIRREVKDDEEYRPGTSALYKALAKVRAPQTEIDWRIDIYASKAPALLHFGYEVDWQKAIAYGRREQFVDPLSGRVVNWENPPGWAKDEYLCICAILEHVSRRCRFLLACKMVIGPEKPTCIASLYSNKEDIALRKPRLEMVLRQIREAFDIDDATTPAWWWDYLECGPRYRSEVAAYNPRMSVTNK